MDKRRSSLLVGARYYIFIYLLSIPKKLSNLAIVLYFLYKSLLSRLRCIVSILQNSGLLFLLKFTDLERNILR